MKKKDKVRKAVPSNYVGNGEQRNVSYGELAELENMFNEQVKKFRISFDSKEERDEALFDFTQQYINGNDDPKVNYVDVYTKGSAASGNPGVTVSNTGLNKAGGPPKAPIQTIDTVKLATIEQHLNNGRLGQAMLELENVVNMTGDTRCRVALYRLLQYMGGNSGNNKDIDHHVLLAAQRGHICSMNLIFDLLGFDWTINTRYWRRLSNILDPMDNLKYDLDHFKNISVVDVIDALHEPDSHYYNDKEAEKFAIKFGIKIPATLQHDETTIIRDDAVEVGLLNKAQAYLKKRDKITAEKLYDKLETINSAHGVFVKSLIYHSFLEYDKFFDNVKKGARLGIVAHMYTLSAIYRCGFGGAKKSSELADAWFWMATQCDNEECRGLDTVFDFDFVPLEFFLCGWKFYFDNPSFQWDSIIKGEKPDVQ